MFIWRVRKVLKEAFKILNHCPFREQHVHHNWTFSKHVYMIMCNKDMATNICLIILKKPFPKEPKFWPNEQKTMNFLLWYSLKFE